MKCYTMILVEGIALQYSTVVQHLEGITLLITPLRNVFSNEQYYEILHTSNLHCASPPNSTAKDWPPGKVTTRKA
jgi:hypothetical protein